MSIEFKEWPKTPRLRKAGSTIITEKIDGTNACVVIVPTDEPRWENNPGSISIHEFEGQLYSLGAQSRKRLIYPMQDNSGFAQWVASNDRKLVELLGPGYHYGEWWGQGIQRRYGMKHKVFSLFNVGRWLLGRPEEDTAGWLEQAAEIHMDTVPIVYQGKFSDLAIDTSLAWLRREGSPAALRWGAGFQPAEGIVLRHRELGGNLKVMLENDDTPKGAQ